MVMLGLKLTPPEAQKLGLTVTLGIRLDHYDSYAPAQTGVLGHQIDQIRGPLWNNLGPRLGIVYGVTSDQKTIIKANYGQYWTTPGPELSGTYGANASTNYSTYVWSDPSPPKGPAT